MKTRSRNGVPRMSPRSSSAAETALAPLTGAIGDAPDGRPSVARSALSRPSGTWNLTCGRLDSAGFDGLACVPGSGFGVSVGVGLSAASAACSSSLVLCRSRRRFERGSAELEPPPFGLGRFGERCPWLLLRVDGLGSGAFELKLGVVGERCGAEPDDCCWPGGGVLQPQPFLQVPVPVDCTCCSAASKSTFSCEVRAAPEFGLARDEGVDITPLAVACGPKRGVPCVIEPYTRGGDLRSAPAAPLLAGLPLPFPSPFPLGDEPEPEPTPPAGDVAGSAPPPRGGDERAWPRPPGLTEAATGAWKVAEGGRPLTLLFRDTLLRLMLFGLLLCGGCRSAAGTPPLGAALLLLLLTVCGLLMMGRRLAEAIVPVSEILRLSLSIGGISRPSSARVRGGGEAHVQYECQVQVRVLSAIRV